MEPFGLLNFLQSLLTQNAENSTQNTENTSPPTAENPSDLSPPASATPPQEKTENEKKQEAILAFLDEHDRRAKNVKK